MRRLIITTLVLLCLTTTGVLSAYTIYLKDGSRLIAKEAHRIEDGKAIIVLQNGTQTFIDAAEVDLERTKRANQGRYGTAFMIDEDGQVVDAPVSAMEKEQTLTDVSRRPPSANTRPPTTRQAPGIEGTEDLAKTETGLVDLSVFPRTPYRDLDIAAESARFLRALGVDEFHIYQGTVQGRAFVELTTNSEASVFRSLEAAADMLIHLNNLYPDTFAELELLMITANRERAGQFNLDLASAQKLARNEVDVSTFFVDNVQF